jgi:hypothetical protein
MSIEDPIEDLAGSILDGSAVDWDLCTPLDIGVDNYRIITILRCPEVGRPRVWSRA